MTKIEHPHIVILCLDSVRKDYYDKYASRLSKHTSIRFDGMRALSSWSVPSHAGMLTGEIPSETGVHAHQRHFAPISLEDTWLSDFKGEGYETVCVSANIYASPDFGFDRFFDRTYVVAPSCRFPDGMDIRSFLRERDEDGIRSYLKFSQKLLTQDHPLKSLLNAVLFKSDELSRRLPVKKPFDYGGASITKILEKSLLKANKPQCVFANLMDAHGPHAAFRGMNDDLYDAPLDFDSRDFNDWTVSATEGLGTHEKEVEMVRGLYAAEIEYLDRIISGFVKRVRKESDRDVYFVITSDHGENLGYDSEDYMMNHVASLSEALLHVPFDVITPRPEEKVNGLASHADLGKILTAIREKEPLKQFNRESAYAEIIGSGSGLPDDGNNEYWDRGQRVIYQDGRKYYTDELGNEAVYDVSGAPSIQRRLSEVEVPEGLFDKYFGPWVVQNQGESDPPDISEATKARLKELGYI